MKTDTATPTPIRRPPGRRFSFPVEPDLSVPPRGGEPKSIGQLMRPIQRIIRHPDRNRLMAEFCKRYW